MVEREGAMNDGTREILQQKGVCCCAFQEMLFMSVVHLIHWCGNKNSRRGTPLAL